MPFIPHTETDIRRMLDAIGADSIDDLFDEIPAALRSDDQLDLPAGLNEMEITRLAQQRAARDGRYVNFIGAGAYEHHVPAAVWELTTRGEFYTAYTPYQAEASQGTLQLLYEYQSMMAALMAMDVSNASMYDGASALGEAVLMAIRVQRKPHKVLMPKTVNPAYRKVVHNLVWRQGIELPEVDYDPAGGHVTIDALEAMDLADAAALVIPQPNFFGVLEDVDALTDWAHDKGLLVIGVVNPLAMSLLKPPGQWGSQAAQGGADIVVGEGQPLGAPLSSGGPYFGFMCCTQKLVRQMPGRIIGRTVDLDGKEGFTLTLQAREQHIRRGKATSNICTNQGLLVTAATIFMALKGPQGLKDMALQSHANTRKLVEKLTASSGVHSVFNRPVFHESVIRLDAPAQQILRAMETRGIVGGYDLGPDYPELGDAVLVCATEMRTEEEMDDYADKLAEVV
ncbi:MAG: aminomethyl-transferring glycine dehydrogenase subunit GcvPA [Gammaproteobacteria bacterium]|nr:MAG: aminomethyl-transferring glycine dehydrogenase subunit GcvPA [Gammaproteobacteria bacterium]